MKKNVKNLIFCCFFFVRAYAQDDIFVTLGGKMCGTLPPEQMRTLLDLKAAYPIKSYNFYCLKRTEDKDKTIYGYSAYKTEKVFSLKDTVVMDKRLRKTIKKAKDGYIYSFDSIKVQQGDKELYVNPLYFEAKRGDAKDTVRAILSKAVSLFESKTGGRVRYGWMAAQNKLLLHCDDCQIVSFSLHFAIREDGEMVTYEINNEGASFSNQVQAALYAAKPGSICLFTNIKIRYGFGEEFYTCPMRFMVV